MQIFENYVIDPPERKRANYKVVPFLEDDLFNNSTLNYTDSRVNNYFHERFPEYRIAYTSRGRSGISLALQALNLNKHDVVTILTTTGNFYISSCVTNTIETICRWSRDITPDTKVILVNHEFGYCYENLNALRQYNVPIIEDFAHSFSATNEEHSQGTVGDFLVFSFSKFFPIQIGGMLLHRNHYQIEEDIHSDMKYYIQNVVGHYIDNINLINQQRLHNYHYLKKLFLTLSCPVHFELKEGAIPAVFMFNFPPHIDIVRFKEFMNRQGVESSIFYGTHAYFIPSHQNFTDKDLYYFYVLVKFFLQHQEQKDFE